MMQRHRSLVIRGGLLLVGVTVVLVFSMTIRSQRDSPRRELNGAERNADVSDAASLRGAQPDPVPRPAPTAPESEVGVEPSQAEFLLTIRFPWRIPSQVLLKGIVESVDGRLHIFEMPLQPKREFLDVLGHSPIGGQLHLELFVGGEVIRATPMAGTGLSPGNRAVLPPVEVSGPAIRGRLVDARTRLPVSGVEVKLHEMGHSDGRPLGSDRTGDSGLFRLDGVGKGPWTVRIYPPREYAAPDPVGYERLASEPREILLHRLSPVRIQPLWRGEPISARFLRLSLRTDSGEWLTTASSDDSGAIWVPPGEYEVRARYEHAFVRQPLEPMLGQRIDEGGLEISAECLLHDGAGLLDLGMAGPHGEHASSGEVLI